MQFSRWKFTNILEENIVSILSPRQCIPKTVIFTLTITKTSPSHKFQLTTKAATRAAAKATVNKSATG
jgi:hypothetical protein